MKSLRAALLRSPHIAWRTVIKFFADNGQFLASGIAFDLLLYCIPFSLLFISALGYALGGDPTQALSLVTSFGSRCASWQTLLLPWAAPASPLLGFVFTLSIFYLLYMFSPREALVRPALFVASLPGAGLFEISKAAFIWFVKLPEST